MKPAPFAYHAPTTQAEALDLLATHGDDAKILAGGQSLVPVMALRLSRFDHLVDINGVAPLAGIDHGADTTTIGATTRQSAVLADAQLARTVPLLARATRYIGHVPIRNRGTVGGSLSHADGAAELPAVAVTLGARLEATSSRGSREIAAADFFVGPFMTLLEPDELLTRVAFPTRQARSGYAVEELSRRHGDFALAGAMAAVRLGADGDTVDRADLTLFGVSGAPVRIEIAPRLVGRSASDAALDDIGQEVVADLELTSDIHASGAYRKRVAARLASKVLHNALEEARG